MYMYLAGRESGPNEEISQWLEVSIEHNTYLTLGMYVHDIDAYNQL